MSLSDPITLTYDAVSVSLNRINQDNYGAEYYAESGTKRFTMSVKHTIPAKGKSGESHLVRLDVEHYDAGGVLLRTTSAWTVIRTDNGVQELVACEDTTAALVAFLTPANITKIAGRQS